MVTLSLSISIVEELEKELIRAHELNNLRLYKRRRGCYGLTKENRGR